jgi:hypothetical protein
MATLGLIGSGHIGGTLARLAVDRPTHDPSSTMPVYGLGVRRSGPLPSATCCS